MNPRFVPFMSKFYSSVIFLLLFASITSCTRNDAQREFEQEAYSAPNNFTETTSQGTIVSEQDEDDWRTSPRFQGLIEINPPYPNPVQTNQNVLLEVEVTGVQSVSDIEVFVRLDNGELRSVYRHFDPIRTGITVFTINPIEFGISSTPEEARGLKRIYLFDLNNRMISYGDILVE